MKKMTKWTVSLLAVMLILAGCGTGETPTKVDKSDEPAEEVSADEEATEEEETDEEAEAEDGTEADAEEVSVVTAGVGETLDYAGLQITLESVTEYVDEGEFAMDEPEEGNTYIVLNFLAENTKTEDDHINMFYEESYVDGFAIEPEPVLFNIKGDTIWGDIAAGKKAKGYIAYEVPQDWQEIEFQYTPEIFGGQETKMIFIATPADLQ